MYMPKQAKAHLSEGILNPTIIIIINKYVKYISHVTCHLCFKSAVGRKQIQDLTA